MSFKFDPNVIHRYLNLMVDDPFHRYWSWDFCFNSFSESRETNKDSLALSLASYLASWGMYRGSGGLLQKNHRIHEQAVEIINSEKYDLVRCHKNLEIDRSLIPLILDLKASIGAYYNSLDFIRGGLGRHFKILLLITLLLL
ncbi:hypothetical protein [Niastella vici]|uniref:hypothetical protein n=1 Tax=Niastella vici TaxID=1703345 RepID=UPI00117DA09B|nr:hypothetical protein [Niastella vici]